MEDSDSFNRHIESNYVQYKGCYLWESEFDKLYYVPVDIGTDTPFSLDPKWSSVSQFSDNIQLDTKAYYPKVTMYQCRELIDCFSKTLEFEYKEPLQTYMFDTDEQLWREVHLDKRNQIINEDDKENKEKKDDKNKQE